MTPAEIKEKMAGVRLLDERGQIAFLASLEVDDAKEAKADVAGRPASPLDLGKLVFRQAFQLGRHTEYLNQRLLEVAAGTVDRLLVTMPPQHFKSETCSHLFPAWFLANHPDEKVILAGYGSSFAEEWGRKVRNTLEEFGDLWGIRIDQQSRAGAHWNIEGHRGGMHSAGIGGPITGHGASLLLIDDPIKDQSEAFSAIYRKRIIDWYQSVAYTRLAPRGKIVLVQCMVGGTRILMADGTEKALRYIRAGDAVATYDNGRISASVVLNWKSQGVDRIFAIRTSSGIIVKANRRHPFLVDRNGSSEWVRLQDLKVGENILRVIGGSGEASSARTKNAASQRYARATAALITANSYGRADIDRRLSIQCQTEQDTCGTGTASTSRTTTPCWNLRAEIVQFAGCRQLRMCGPIGVANSALTMTHKPEKFAACSVTTVISQSAMARRKKHCLVPLDTFEITRDRIVEISDAGSEEVFDIQVEGTENFIANGLVSHNTRWHAEDLAGKVLAQASDPKADQWEHVNFPAIAEQHDILGRQPGEALFPERYDLAELNRRRNNMERPFWWEALYQQHPPQEFGQVIDVDLLRGFTMQGDYYRLWDELNGGNFLVAVHPSTCLRITVVDCAGSSEDVAKEAKGHVASWSVISTFDVTPDGKFILREITRGRWPFPRLVEETASAYNALKPSWLGIEDEKTGRALLQTLTPKGYNLRALQPEGKDKLTRAAEFLNRLKARQVYIGRESPWRKDLTSEFVMWTGHPDEQSDQIDTFAYACREWQRTGGMTIQLQSPVFAGELRGGSAVGKGGW